MAAPSTPLEPRGWLGGPLAYGASFGRPSKCDGYAFGGKIKLYLRRVRIDSGGYDSGGAYWGIGRPLYWAGDDSGAASFFFTAGDRAAAKAECRKRYPAATFYR